MSAIFSSCGKYRYTLHRKLAEGPEKLALFVMLNPSTADATQDDPTIRRCIGFASRENCTELTVVNLFALRSSNPENLAKSVEPIGPDNDFYIQNEIERLRGPGGIIVAAWGANRFARVRASNVISKILGGPTFCLNMTKDGSPRHPLYVKSDAPLVPFTFEPIPVGQCVDCGIEIHPEATHTGHQKWCEDCFDRGLTKDMSQHWDDFWANEMKASETK